MVQLEVAERIEAKAGTRDYGVLAILVQLQADVTRLLTLPPGAFRPVPDVRSAVLRLTFRQPRVSVPDPALFETMVRSMFTQRRKTLTNALKPFDAAAAEVIARAGFDGRRRPETLQLTEIARLAELFAVRARTPVL